MLTELHIKNFKFHRNLNLLMKPITVMTGMNGMGKSSVIQSMLLLRQSGRDLVNGLNLKGDLCDVGTFGEVYRQDAEGNDIEFSVQFHTGEKLDFQFTTENELDTFVRNAKGNKKQYIPENESLFNDNFQYISAFRFGPQKNYARDTSIVGQHHQVSKEKGQCEYAVHYLYEYAKEPMLPQLRYKGTPEIQLEDQMEYWMSAIASKIRVNVEIQGTDLALSYGYRGKTKEAKVSAVNTGFGITYVLPVLVSILTAKPGHLIIIENPEAHIHPKGQAVLMQLIAQAVSCGIQIVIETHSDHIINGLMVAIHNQILKSENVALYYIQSNEDEHASDLCPIHVEEDGRISDAPNGFFDQIDIDLQTIVGF